MVRDLSVSRKSSAINGPKEKSRLKLEKGNEKILCNAAILYKNGGIGMKQVIFFKKVDVDTQTILSTMKVTGNADAARLISPNDHDQ